MVSPVTTPITGSEDKIDSSRPEGALAEFYRAFNTRDLALMESNWAASDEASMDNPLGGIRRGWGEIGAVYARIFESQARVTVAFHDYTLHRFGETFLAVGREHGTFTSGDMSLDLRIRTSRLFLRAGDRWRQIHHHGSIEDPELLARYQAAVR